MSYSTFATFTVVLVTYTSSVLGWTTTESPPPPTTTGPSITNGPSTCYTITTAGPTCPPLPCPIPACLKISTITQSCGCPSIFTAYSCTNSCTDKCLGTSYNTVYIPCPTSPPPHSTSSSEPSTESTTAPPPEVSTTKISYGNSTITSAGGTGGSGGVVTVTSETTTIPGNTTPGNTGPKPTTTSLVEANMAGRSVLTEGGLLAGLIAAVLGML